MPVMCCELSVTEHLVAEEEAAHAGFLDDEDISEESEESEEFGESEESEDSVDEGDD